MDKPVIHFVDRRCSPVRTEPVATAVMAQMMISWVSGKRKYWFRQGVEHAQTHQYQLVWRNWGDGVPCWFAWCPAQDLYTHQIVWQSHWRKTRKKNLIIFYQQNYKNREFIEKYSQVPEYINEITRPAEDAVTNEGVEARLHCKRQPLPKINEVLR